MLKFMRNKIVGVELKDNDTLIATGTLADDMYGMRLAVTVRRSDMTITAIRGWLDRYTTPECPEADTFLQEAVGLRVDDPQFGRQVHRTIWRHACQHYASLLEDCGESLRQAAQVLSAQSAHSPRPSSAPTQNTKVPGESRPASPTEARVADGKPAGHFSGEGFVVDLHLHTLPASPCASAAVADMIREAKAMGLDGICLTDHNHVWDPADVAALGEAHDFVVLRGNEITTDQGDILVYGLEADIQGIIPLEELREQVLAVGGLMIAAHPFRGFLTFGVGELGLTVESAKLRPLFRSVDGIEIRNGKVTEDENRFAEQVAEALGLLAVGGSDAHKTVEVGRYATRFKQPVRTEKALIAALRSGEFSVVRPRSD